MTGVLRQGAREAHHKYKEAEERKRQLDLEMTRKKEIEQSETNVKRLKRLN